MTRSSSPQGSPPLAPVSVAPDSAAGRRAGYGFRYQTLVAASYVVQMLGSNDTTHANGFVDILRGLVRERGYQVVVSTHDLALGDFVRRKLASAELPWVVCDYEAMRPDGVRTHVRRWTDAEATWRMES